MGDREEMRKPMVKLVVASFIAVCIITVLVMYQQSIISKEQATEKDTTVATPSSEIRIEKSGIIVSSYDSTSVIDDRLSAMSEDQRKFVFHDHVGTTFALYIADLNNQKFVRHDLPQNNPTNGIMALEWIDDDTIGVEGHINPYIRSYYMLNVSNGIWSEPLHGLFFTWTPKGLFYAEAYPNSHGGNSIKSADGTVVYSIHSEESKSIIEGLWFNATGNRVAYFEQSDVDYKITLVIATFDDPNTLHIDKRIPYAGATGDIEWSGENQIEISQGGSSTRVTIKLE